MPLTKAVLRIIDANSNRLGEGLRVLEEIARFVLDDATLTSELKNLRHRFSPKDPAVKQSYIDARDAAADIGPSVKLDTTEPIRTLSQTVTANARRAQESLRVLEELAKTADTGLDSAVLQDARFAVYAIEKTLLARLLRQDKVSLIRSLHAVMDISILGARRPADTTHEMLRGGARVIRLCGHIAPKRKLLEIALEIAEPCREYGALFIISHDLDVALAASAGGLHLDQEDLPAKTAREFLPVDRVIGCSVQSTTQARQAFAYGADYLDYDVTSIITNRADPTPNYTPITQIKNEVNLPLIATGDISPRKARELLRTGADGIATTNILLTTSSIEAITRDFIKILEVPCESDR